MNFEGWFQAWLKRHPLKAPQEPVRSRYTAEVMSRIRMSSPQSSEARWAAIVQPWLSWPRLAVAGAALAAGLVFVVSTNRPVPSAPQLAEQVNSLAEEVDTMEQLILAASTPIDAEWIEHTVQLLDQFDEDVPENLLDELELLDQANVSI